MRATSRLGRRGARAEKKASTILSHEPAVGVEVEDETRIADGPGQMEGLDLALLVDREDSRLRVMHRPTMSSSLAPNSGSFERLQVRTRCGCSLWGPPDPLHPRCGNRARVAASGVP